MLKNELVYLTLMFQPHQKLGKEMKNVMTCDQILPKCYSKPYIYTKRNNSVYDLKICHQLLNLHHRLWFSENVMLTMKRERGRETERRAKIF